MHMAQKFKSVKNKCKNTNYKSYLPVPGSKRSTSLSPREYAFNVLPLMWGPGAVLTEPGSWVTSRRPLGGIKSSPCEEVTPDQIGISWNIQYFKYEQRKPSQKVTKKISEKYSVSEACTKTWRCTCI